MAGHCVHRVAGFVCFLVTALWAAAAGAQQPSPQPVYKNEIGAGLGYSRVATGRDDARGRAVAIAAPHFQVRYGHDYGWSVIALEAQFMGFNDEDPMVGDVGVKDHTAPASG